MSIAFTRFHKTVVVLLLASGCRSGDMMSPSRSPVTVAADYVPVAGGSVTVPIRDQSTPDITVTLPPFNRRTLVRATMAGTVDISPSPYNPGTNVPEPGQPRTVGPAGFRYTSGGINYCGAQLVISYGTMSDFWMPCVDGTSLDTVVSVRGFFYADAGEGGSVVRTAGSPAAWNCSNPPYPGTGPC
jgi:hypothetical protein